jgi:hypothetical protein
MKHPRVLPPSRKFGLLFGLLFGLIMGSVDIFYWIILSVIKIPIEQPLADTLSNLFNHSALTSVIYATIMSLPIYFLLLITFFLAGFLASRKTKKGSTGLLAALWTGVVYAILDIVGSRVLLSLITIPKLTQDLGTTSAANIQQIETSLLTFSFFYTLIAGLIVIGIGVGIGALGAFLGKRTKKGAEQVQPYSDLDQPPYKQGQLPAEIS